ncbi:MAG TPA: hypothetical protein VN698_06695 [Bacteroidia bacterium]|nr:hypothetical protein [Bacteroidia bacterium]
MTKHLKINTALLICLVFVFKLLFVNINLLSSYTSQTNHLLAKYFSATQKRKQNAEVAVKSNIIDYSSVEVCEEDSDNEKDFVKTNSPIILSTLCSFFKYVAFIPKSNGSFNLIKCDLHSKKYLTLSILRI